jgi:biotin synthase
MFEKLLDKAANGRITKKLALLILQEAQEPANGLKLFERASKIRDEILGKKLYWSAGISQVIPCRIVPRCRYCTYYARGQFNLEKLARTAKKMEELGLKQIHLSGGSSIQGYDAEILDMVRAVRKVSDIDIEVNLGCSISQKTVRKLKQMKLLSITSSLETVNENVFQTAKPGDSLEKKKQLMETCEREGVPIRSMILIGMGESLEDRINHLFYVRKYSRLGHLNFSRFYPYPDTEYRDHPRCSPWEVATTVAVARLIMPRVHLGLAAGNTTDDIPLWYAAGGGNQVLGAHISRTPVTPGPGKEVIPVEDDIVIVNRMPVVRQYLEGMGREIGFERPYDES